jgi:predicted MarR family transcription regulator
MRSMAYLLGIPSFGECSSNRYVVAFTNIYALLSHDLQNIHNKLYILEKTQKKVLINMTIPNSMLTVKYPSDSEFTKGSGASAQYSNIQEKSSEVNVSLVC